MKYLKKTVSGLLTMVLALSLLAGCNGAPETSPSPANSPTPSGTAAGGDMVEITDLMGNTVQVPSPETLKSIAVTSYKGAFSAAIFLGQVDKIAAMCDFSNFPWLLHAFPALSEIPDYGSFDEVNVEQILQAGIDVVISPSDSADVNQKMRDLGIAVLEDGVNIEDSSDVFKQTYNEIDLVANLTGTSDTAQEYYQWADGIYDFVAQRVKDIPDDQRVTVVPIRNDINQVFGNNCIWGHVVELAGGINLSGDITASTGKFFADIDAEQMVAWNPDFIFHINFYGALDETTSENFNTWAGDKRYAGITAFQNGDVYLVPKGVDHWNSVIEAPLGVLWMAKLMYPDRFEDVDVKAYAQEFYQKYMNYTLTEEDWAILAVQYKGANPNGLSAPVA